MLVEELSNHPRDELRRSQAGHQRRVEEHLEAVDRLRAQQAAAGIRWWQIGAWLTQRRELRSLQAGAPGVDPETAISWAKLAAGIEGEEAMSTALQRLPDDWRLFRGYKNRRGEVDLLLVGPGGVWAIEVKARGVRVHVDGDRWSYEKIRYGSVVDQGVLEDRGGRSWGRQVTEIAHELEMFLVSRGQLVTVHTAVVLLHPQAELGSHRDIQVDAFSVGEDYFFERLHAEPRGLNRSACEHIAALVRRDHAFHVARRAARDDARRRR